jgi:hypothetical protein
LFEEKKRNLIFMKMRTQREKKEVLLEFEKKRMSTANSRGLFVGNEIS